MVSTSGHIMQLVNTIEQIRAEVEQLREEQGRGVGARELALAITELEVVAFRLRTAADLISASGQ